MSSIVAEPLAHLGLIFIAKAALLDAAEARRVEFSRQ
jgi:hypothetical protein